MFPRLLLSKQRFRVDSQLQLARSLARRAETETVRAHDNNAVIDHWDLYVKFAVETLYREAANFVLHRSPVYHKTASKRNRYRRKAIFSAAPRSEFSPMR